jgi:hypothetical protein
MADATSWADSRAFRVAFAVFMVLAGFFELITKHTATQRAIGLAWLVFGIGWGIRCQFTPKESSRQSLIGLALCSLLIGASYIIAAGTDTFFGLVWLFAGVMWGIRALRTEEARPSLLPPDEPSGSTPSSGSEPPPNREIGAQ